MMLYFSSTNTIANYKSWSERILFSLPTFLIETSIDTKVQNRADFILRKFCFNLNTSSYLKSYFPRWTLAWLSEVLRNTVFSKNRNIMHTSQDYIQHNIGAPTIEFKWI